MIVAVGAADTFGTWTLDVATVAVTALVIRPLYSRVRGRARLRAAHEQRWRANVGGALGTLAVITTAFAALAVAFRHQLAAMPEPVSTGIAAAAVVAVVALSAALVSNGWLPMHVLGAWDELLLFVSERRRAVARVNGIFATARLEPTPIIDRVNPTNEGIETVVGILPGAGVTSSVLASPEWMGKLHDAAGAACKGVRADNLSEGGKVRITFVYRDPLATMHLGHAPIERHPELADATKPIVIGENVRGNEVGVVTWKRNVLIGGMLDYGKSGIEALLVAGTILDPRFRCDGIDCKKVELPMWRDAMENVATDAAAGADLIRHYLGLAHERTNAMAEANGGFGMRQHIPTVDDPGYVLFIDEFTMLDEKAQAMLFQVMQLGRACSISTVVAMPRPSSRLMDTDTRSLFDTRIAVRCRDRVESNIILGADYDTLGWDASRLTRQGAFLIAAPGSRPDQCLAYHFHEDRRRPLVELAAEMYSDSSDQTSEEGASAPDEQDGNTGMGAEADGADASRWTLPEGPRNPVVEPPDLASTPAQAVVWETLIAHPDGLGPTELAVASGKPKDTVYKALNAWDGRYVRKEHGKWIAGVDLGDVA